MSAADHPRAFPLDKLIAEGVQYRHAKWADHVRHREHQLENIRRVERAFHQEERRRERLLAAGMGDDPEMTTEEAVREASP